LPLNWTFIVDFDGTIAPDDVTDLLLDRYASAEWTLVEREWQAGHISSRECLERQVALLKLSATDLDAMLAQLTIDPMFPRFVSAAQAAGCDVQIASDGFDRVIETLLARVRIPPLPLAATHFAPAGPDTWTLSFPFASADCGAHAATCKCAFAARVRKPGNTLILIGDGLSDFCLAARADLVLARGRLLEHCRAQSIRHQYIPDFAAALQHLGPRFDEATQNVALATSLEEIANA
jgi:2-hydroxy-3-keto-5-methylthiopentenyl-1-phosphate phosphatase